MPGAARAIHAGPAIGAAALVASCTLLVHFDDAAGGPCDGGACDAEAAAPEAGPPDAPAPPDAAARDVELPRPDHYAPCFGLVTGVYCGNDGLNGYDGSPGDLVSCVDGAVGADTPCDAGCVNLPDPFPDACNPCAARGDGSYCGRLLAGFPAQNADMLVTCAGGTVGKAVPCATGCMSADAGSQCFP